jgi:SAM-dependent methyltransferase
VRLYKDLVWLWPIISPPEDYLKEGEFFIRKIKDHGGPKVKTILNLGSGGGHLDWVLKRELQVTGIDISPAMMDLAKKLNPEAEYIQNDMRTARLNRRFDAVILHDAVAHMQTEEELRAAFLTAYEHLDKGGIFITVVEEWIEHFEQNRTVVGNFRKDNLEVTFIENNYDPNRSDSTFECTFIYLIRREGFPNIETDRMVLGIFPLATWGKTMREIGFDVIQIESSLANLADGQDGEIYPVLIGIKK